MTNGKILGNLREKSQAAFFSIAAAGMPELTEVAGDHRLMMWLSLQVLERTLDSFRSTTVTTSNLSKPLSSEESDIAHYIGGCVVAKLKKEKWNENMDFFSCFLEYRDADLDSLVGAKSRGNLINLTSPAKSFFAEMELVFRDTFAVSDEKMPESSFYNKCCANQVIQDCYHSLTHCVDDTERVFPKIISFFF